MWDERGIIRRYPWCTNKRRELVHGLCDYKLGTRVRYGWREHLGWSMVMVRRLEVIVMRARRFVVVLLAIRAISCIIYIQIFNNIIFKKKEEYASTHQGLF